VSLLSFCATLVSLKRYTDTHTLKRYTYTPCPYLLSYPCTTHTHTHTHTHTQGHLVEVCRKDLVAEYSGQSAVKTAAKVQEALGGVLFVDEAYSLKHEGSKGNN